MGSIPAYAGEPDCQTGIARNGRVYPRVRGGAIAAGAVGILCLGLSPRTRGSLWRYSAAASRIGSIPAYAGEPVSLSLTPPQRGVYPRVRGGAPMYYLILPGDTGLSPRTRGSPESSSPRPMSVRSIPAYAGEPFLILILFLFRRVYPRVRGGAVFYWFSPLDFLGLSPRTRGSLLPRYSPRALGGSIPAYAGEPFLIECLNHVSGVYPRVRGGAKGPGSLEEGVEGLSPRTRG